MSVKFLSMSVPDCVWMMNASSYLRIAVPSWRSFGIQQRSETEPETETVSREEMLSLFQRELRGRGKKRNPLTALEQAETSLARSIRQALYPDGAGQLQH